MLDDFCLALAPWLRLLFAYGWHLKSNNSRKNAHDCALWQAKMMNKNELSPAEEAQRCFDEIMGQLGWDLATLASQAGYRLETLQKARRENGGVTFNAKMRDAVYAAAKRESDRRKLEEQSATYRVTTYSADQPSATKMIEVSETNMEEVVQELRELAADFLTASVFGRRRLMERIDELAKQMRETLPRDDKSQRPSKAPFLRRE